MYNLAKFNIKTNITYGKGSISTLTNLLEDNQIHNILIVTDKGIVRAGLLDGILTQLEGRDYIVYDGTLPNPTVKNCEEALELLRKCEADIVIGIGGGSPLDVAKAVALLATNGGKITDYEGIDKFKYDILPLVAIPTTAGTASEVTNFTVITDEERQYKLTVGGSKLAANWAILDPLLTIKLPPSITAATGIDALVHAIESYTSKAANDITKCLAREAIVKISGSLRQAVFNGQNETARDEMLMGSLLAGLAFNNTRLGNCHAMSHPLSAVYHVPHGVANAVLISHVMEFNYLAAPQLFADIAEAMGENVEGLSLIDKAKKSVNTVRQLVEDIGIPTNLKSYNVQEEKIDFMAKDAMLSGNILVNPRMTSIEDIKELYLKVI